MQKQGMVKINDQDNRKPDSASCQKAWETNTLHLK